MEYDRNDRVTSGCENGCYNQERILSCALVTGPFTIASTVVGMAFGTWGSGEWLSGEGRLGMTFLGIGIGGTLQLGTWLTMWALDASQDTLTEGGAWLTLLPLAGAVVGYALSDGQRSTERADAGAHWKPLVGVTPDGGLLGVRAAF